MTTFKPVTVIDRVLNPLSYFVPYTLPTLANGIFHVLFMRACKQMIGIDTGRDVTSVANKQACWYRAFMQLIRESVRINSSRQVPITTLVVSGSPEPASSSLVDVCPKSLYDRTFLRFMKTLLGTVTGFDTREAGRECNSTSKANPHLAPLPHVCSASLRTIMPIPRGSAHKLRATYRTLPFGGITTPRALACYTSHVVDLLTRLTAVPRVVTSNASVSLCLIIAQLEVQHDV
jgi:hypothetical protein